MTKDGTVAGPRVLEHLVDCVLQFEGDRYHAHRVLRAAKNRFGSTNELGLFEMTGAGLVGVAEPSELFGRGAEGEVGAAVAGRVSKSAGRTAQPHQHRQQHHDPRGDRQHADQVRHSNDPNRSRP